jgi:hypothetical protein
MSFYFEPNSVIQGNWLLQHPKYFTHTFQGKTEKEGFVTIRFELFHSIRKNV